ncbi:ATP-dependent DNA helicase PIF1, partial [Exaiptasia diaphana]
MLDAILFEKLEFVARKVRNVEAPFGGIQLLLFGDFYQLPPVPNDEEKDALYCFESPLWKVVIKHNVELTIVFRQKEPEYLLLLSEVRSGQITWQTHSILQRLKRTINTDDESIYIYSRRDDVAIKNGELLENVNGETKVYMSKDTGKKELLNSCQAPKKLSLKVGARVILLKNMHSYGLVNGERGKVLEFVGKFPLVQFEDGQKVIMKETVFEVLREGHVQATRRQLPLDLGWSVTVHKAQGITVEKSVVSLKRIFAPGQAYVALSRCRTMAGLQVIPGDDIYFPPPPHKVVDFYNKMKTMKTCMETEIETQIEDLRVTEPQTTQPTDLPPCDWDNIAPLPTHVSVSKMLKSIAENPLNSQETKDLCSKLNFDKDILQILQM